MENKICTCCGEEKPATDFRNVGRRNGGIATLTICQDCMRERQRLGRAKKKAERSAKAQNEVMEARALRLSNFTPRELMEEWQRRGYEGKLHFTRVEEIDISNF